MGKNVTGAAIVTVVRRKMGEISVWDELSFHRKQSQEDGEDLSLSLSLYVTVLNDGETCGPRGDIMVRQRSLLQKEWKWVQGRCSALRLKGSESQTAGRGECSL